LLSGKYQRDDKASTEGRRAAFDFPPVEQDRAYACIDTMKPMAEQRKISVAQIAIAWLLHQKVVTSVIIGAKRLDQLNDNIAAADVILDETEIETLNKVSALPREYPGWMLDRQSTSLRQTGK
jgi:aryl-alcohol dehydrogenase-like predicted oxidoreductase